MLIAVRKRNAKMDEMCDLKTLRRWVRTGDIRPDDLIKEDGEWVPAIQATVLKGVFATAAWDVDEDVLWKPQLKQTNLQSSPGDEAKIHSAPSRTAHPYTSKSIDRVKGKRIEV